MGGGLPPEEVEITKLINERLRREDCLAAEDRETVAYRIAEIMVAAKRMHTSGLARITNLNGESNAPMDEDLTGLRMTFLHLCDLMHDFDSAFFRSIRHGLPEVPPEREEEPEADPNY